MTILTRWFLRIGMPMYTRKSGSRRYHFVEDNLHFPGEKKKSLLEKKRSLEEDTAGMWNTYEFPTGE